MTNKKRIITIFILIVIGVIVFLILSPKKKTTSTVKNIGVPNDVQRSEGELIKQALSVTIKLLSTASLPIPDIYNGCSGSTINKINFCGNLKASGGYDIGGNFACNIPYSACKAACTAGCIACKIIPLIKCGKPCDSCPKGCKTVYDACSKATKVTWSVNVLYTSGLGNTMDVLNFESFSIDKEENRYLITMRIPVKSSPMVNVDIRTTAEIGNYQGNIGLGNLKIIIPMELYYDCVTKQTTLKKLNLLKVEGINLAFHFAPTISGKLKDSIYSLAKGKLESVVKNVLQTKLTPIFEKLITNQLLPQLQLNINC